jgi:hypothetical protein
VKRLLFAFLILMPVVSNAAMPEDDYLAARDAAAAAIKALDDAKKGDEALKQQQASELELTAKLQPVIGPIAIRGFAITGKANIGSLLPGNIDTGLLDGMIYPAPDNKGFLIVTTEMLLKHWLVEHKDWWGAKTENVPQQIPAALASNAFYTQALETDAAISRYAELPVKAPAGVPFVHAMLVARSQILDPSPPDELLISLVKDGRVFIVSAPAETKVKLMPACVKFWTDLQKKSEDKASTAFTRCFAGRAPTAPFFAPLVKQAQALVDGLVK